jgi:hypothetical protein
MAEFHEDGVILDVDVLEDTSDDEWFRYKLRVNKVIQSSEFIYDPAIGAVFVVNKVKKDAGCFGMWYLYGYDKDKKGELYT